MTTLATMKADIADDLVRTDLTSSIADAITRAIEHYQPARFWFNETRSETFDTVAAQPRYSSADDAAIPEFVTLDGLVITVAGQNRPLRLIDPVQFELLLDNSASTGQPYSCTYYDITIGLYPIPDQIYTVRMLGHIKKAAPANDAEANNVWMTHAYQLIRSRATADVAQTKMHDFEYSASAVAREDSALRRLQRETSKRIGSGCIQATSF